MRIHSLNAAGDRVEFASWVDFFNPTINNRWKEYNDSYWTISEWIALFGTLYSKENLEQFEVFEDLMFNGAKPTEGEHQKFLELSADIPDEHRWIFVFLSRNGRISDSNYDLKISTPGGIVQRHPVFASDVSIKVIRTPDKEAFTNFIKTYYDAWMEALASTGNANSEPPRYWHVNYINHTNGLVNWIKKFVAAESYCRGPEGWTKARNAHRYIERDGYSVRVSIDIIREVRITLVQTVTKTNRQALYRVHPYSTNVLDFLPYPNKLKNETDPVLIGVELETSTDYTVQQLIDAADEPFFMAKSDGSITGTKTNLMELVTAPSSFKYLKRQYALWFNKLDYMKFDVTTRTNNGMHVHIGRDHFEDQYHIRNFCWFLNNPAHKNFLLTISERGSMASFDQWTPQYNFESAGISRTRAFREIFNFLRHTRGISNCFKGGEDAKTIEVRMFRGVISYASIVKNLELVEALFLFTKGLTSYRQLTLRGFIDWLNATPRNRFTLLKTFIMKSFDLDKEFAYADIKDITFGLREDAKILEAVKNSKVKLTHHHISALNHGKKRTFVIDKATGELTLIIRDRGKLWELDKKFAERYTRHSAA